MNKQTCQVYGEKNEKIKFDSYNTPLETMKDLSKKLGIPMHREMNKNIFTFYFYLVFDIGRIEVTLNSEDLPNVAEALVA